MQNQAEHLKAKLAGPERAAVSCFQFELLTCAILCRSKSCSTARWCGNKIYLSLQATGTGTTVGAEHDPSVNQVSKILFSWTCHAGQLYGSRHLHDHAMYFSMAVRQWALACLQYMLCFHESTSVANHMIAACGSSCIVMPTMIDQLNGVRSQLHASSVTHSLCKKHNPCARGLGLVAAQGQPSAT